MSGETNGKINRRVRDQHPGQESMSGESEMDEEDHDKKQDLESRVLSGEFRWMRRRYGPDLKDEWLSGKTKENISVDAEGILFQVHAQLGRIPSTGNGSI